MLYPTELRALGIFWQGFENEAPKLAKLLQFASKIFSQMLEFGLISEWQIVLAEPLGCVMVNSLRKKFCFEAG